MRVLAPLLLAAIGTAIAPAMTTIIQTYTPTDNIAVSDLTTRTALNTVTPGGIASTYPVRSRRTISQNDVQINSFIEFNPSAVLGTGLYMQSAEFVIDYTQQLNTANPLSIEVGQNTSGSWDSSGSNNPLHDWAFDDETSTVTASNGVNLLANVQTSSPTMTDLTGDVTGIVASWLNGTSANDGFALYYTANDFQGAGFENARLVITLIPEPSRALLLALGLAPLVLRRRR